MILKYRVPRRRGDAGNLTATQASEETANPSGSRIEVATPIGREVIVKCPRDKNPTAHTHPSDVPVHCTSTLGSPGESCESIHRSPLTVPTAVVWALDMDATEKYSKFDGTHRYA